MANRIISYFKEANQELRKVIWPTRRQTMNDTILVIAISLLVAAFLGALDLGLNFGLEKLLDR